jgi:hypothetical protein
VLLQDPVSVTVALAKQTEKQMLAPYLTCPHLSGGGKGEL